MTVDGPDKGYSWVIVFCCAYIHFALFGLFRSWGVIYVEVLKEYDVTREEASWPFSLCSAVFQLVGPVVSIITHYISKRLTCILGSTVATIGVVACYFAPNVMWITIFYGVVHGVGFGVVTTLLPVFVNEYFVKYRATALGIAFSGGAISSFLVPIAMQWLLDNYDLKGSFLILGGVVMNTLVVSALLRPPPWLSKSKKNLKLLADSESKDSGVSTRYAANDVKDIIPTPELPIVFQLRDSVFVESNTDENELSSVTDSSQLYPSGKEGFSKIQDTLLSNNDSILFGGSMSKDCAIADSGSSYKHGNKSPEKTEYELQEPLMNGRNRECKLPKNQNIKKGSKLKNAAVAILEILRNPMFYLITYTMFIYFLALQCFFVVIVDYALDKGIPEIDGKYILSIFSLTDLLGRTGLGWVTDRNYVKRNNMVAFNLVMIGIVLLLYPEINSLTGLLVLAAFHGIPVGSTITLIFVLQAEYLGMKRLTLVLGLAGFINGALSLLRPAMIGLFRDTIGSYNWMFRSLAIISFAFAIIWLVESMTAKTRKSAIINLSEKT